MSTFPLTLTVPEAGRLLYGLGRDASYAAAEKGEIPARKVGRRLVVPTHAALKDLGMSDDLIARALGIEPENATADPATGAATATVHVLAQKTGDPHSAPPV